MMQDSEAFQVPFVYLLCNVHLMDLYWMQMTCHPPLWFGCSLCSHALWLMTSLLDLVQQREAILLTVLEQLIICKVPELQIHPAQGLQQRHLSTRNITVPCAITFLLHQWIVSRGERDGLVASTLASKQKGSGFSPNSVCLPVFFPGTLAFSHGQKTYKLGDLATLVSRYECLFVSICQPCDELVTCPRCSLLLAQDNWDRHPTPPNSECRKAVIESRWMGELSLLVGLRVCKVVGI